MDIPTNFIRESYPTSSSLGEKLNSLIGGTNLMKKLSLLLAIPLLLILSSSLKRSPLFLKSRALSSPAITFPQDHASHPGFSREWWYLNLTSQNLSYVISFSRIGGVNGLLSSRYDNATRDFAQNTDSNGTLSATLDSQSLLQISYTKSNGPSLQLQEIAPDPDGQKRFKLFGQTPQIGTFDLTLQEQVSSSPLLWGCTGNISVFAPNDTYYYSLPGLDISGSIIDIDGTRKEISSGKAWMDHQWFSSSPPPNWKGHYWASFHTDSQAIGLVTQFYSTGPKYSYWVKRNNNGSNECGNTVKFNPTRFFSNNFPSKIHFDTKSISGDIEPLSDNQVFTTPIGPSFFEPASLVSSIGGIGFFETSLKGSPPSPPTPTPTPSVKGCPYDSTQAQVQKNETDPWGDRKSVKLGKAVNLGGFHNHTGLFAKPADVDFFITDLDQSTTKLTPPYPIKFRPTMNGVYSFVGKTRNSSGEYFSEPRCQDNGTIEVR